MRGKSPLSSVDIQPFQRPKERSLRQMPDTEGVIKAFSALAHASGPFARSRAEDETLGPHLTNWASKSGPC